MEECENKVCIAVRSRGVLDHPDFNRLNIGRVVASFRSVDMDEWIGMVRGLGKISTRFIQPADPDFQFLTLVFIAAAALDGKCRLVPASTPR